jgi:hypothetical protein
MSDFYQFWKFQIFDKLPVAVSPSVFIEIIFNPAESTHNAILSSLHIFPLANSKNPQQNGRFLSIANLGLPT